MYILYVYLSTAAALVISPHPLTKEACEQHAKIVATHSSVNSAQCLPVSTKSAPH